MAKKRKKTEEKQELIYKIIKYVIFGISVLFLAFIIFGRFINPISNWGVYKQLDMFSDKYSYNAWLRSISIIVCISTISSVLRALLMLSLRLLDHGKSYVSLFTSFIKYISVVVIAFLVLACFGVDTTTIVAGIGILSLIIGLAIQPLLQDIIAGIFIVFEKIYDIGDVIIIDGFRGTVIEIGIRTTKIKDAGGDIKVINNSDIKTLINMSGDLSVAISDIEIEYDESLEKVEKVLEAELENIKEKIPTIVDGPYYKGVAELGASGVKLRVIAQCKEDSKFQTQRDLNRQLKLLFDKNNINIPFTQIVLHQAPEPTKNKKVTGKTEAFVLKQNELSVKLSDDNDEK